jgi:hypothetical protein
VSATVRRLVPAALLVAALAGCPQERPGVTREVPRQRVPPAMSLDPAPQGPGARPDGGTALPRDP